MEKVNATLIATVYNEKKTIQRFLDSILEQSVLPKEVVITDGGSSDGTVAILSSHVSVFKQKHISLVVKIKRGNRSVGRNEAIRLAKHEVILITDAGCDLDKNWVREVTKPFKVETKGADGTNETREVEVVAGYYAGKAKTVFEKSLIPYVLVMPDRVDPDTFLPATRSMAIRKKVFEKAGGFDEKYSHNEDYVFAHHLKDMGAKIVFQKSAIVYWYPRSGVNDAYHMFWRFAYGDAESGILRRKVVLLFSRYMVAGSLIVVYLLFRQSAIGLCILIAAVGYFAWSIAKNYRYVLDLQAFFYLPLLQIISDIAVISGTIQGGVKSRWAIRKMS